MNVYISFVFLHRDRRENRLFKSRYLLAIDFLAWYD